MTWLGSSAKNCASIRSSWFHFDSPQLQSCSEEVCCRSSSLTPSWLLLDGSEWMRKPSPSPSGPCSPWSPVGLELFSLWAAQSHWNLALWHWGEGERGGEGVARGSSPLLIGWSHMWLIQFFDLNLLWCRKRWWIKLTAAAETPDVCLSTIRTVEQSSCDDGQQTEDWRDKSCDLDEEDEELMLHLMLRNRAAATALLSVRPRGAGFAILPEETHGMASPS